MVEKVKKNWFLFQELVKRDFKKKYKRTVLGMLWSVLSPLMQLLVMSVVFTRIFRNDMAHFTIYLFSGNLVFSFFKDSTTGGMNSLMMNSNIITKINVPKYLFLLSKNVSSCINFGLTLLTYFVFVAIEGLPFTWRFLLLVYPIVCLLVFNVGIGFILSALFVVFKDMQYLYDIFTLMLMYMSAIFYPVSRFEPYTSVFYLNPVYAYISYFRKIVIDGVVPSWQHHGLCLLYAAVALAVGALIYKKYNYKFLYYM